MIASHNNIKFERERQHDFQAQIEEQLRIELKKFQETKL